MTERPILLNTPMVRAVLDGTKWQTRRVCKPAQVHGLSFVVEVPDPKERGQVYNCSHFGDEEGDVRFASPFGGVGDRLWVREAWNRTNPGGNDGVFYYRADSHFPAGIGGGPIWPDASWRPSIHMPRQASRLTLRVNGVRVERLNAISEEDAIAEGLLRTDRGAWLPGPCDHPQWAFRELWNQVYGPDAWDANPWVWVVCFERIGTSRGTAP